MFNWNWSLSLPILSNLFGHHGGAPTPTSHVTPSDSRAVTFTSGVKTSSVKVILADDRALMPVNVNGEKFELIVDTGSTIRCVCFLPPSPYFCIFRGGRKRIVQNT